MAETLRKEGHEVIEAGNGVEGLQAFVEHKPNLVITNVRMPEMDGVELCRRLREISEVSILAVTGLPGSETEAAILAADANGFMAKPLEVCALID